MVAVNNKTFKYGPTGPVGLLTNKKVYVCIASGGVALGSPVDFASPYLKQLFKFIGVTDVTFIDGCGGKKEVGLKQIEELNLE